MTGWKIKGTLFCIGLLCMQASFFVFGQEEERERAYEAVWQAQVQVPEAEMPQIDLYASSAALVDAATGRVLYGKNENTPMAMASTTKIMTCITVLEYGNPEDMLQVSGYASGMPKVKLYLKKGESYRVGDLLYSLMLESHNDSAVALAEYVGKQFLSQELQKKDTAEFTKEESRQAVAAFGALMNQKAAELGCENTYFITPNGLDATETVTEENGEQIQREHCTTAAELARMMAYCIGESPEREEFLKITRTAQYGFSANGRSFSCNNHNAFLNMMPGALSGKTGFTNKAGYCYVGALRDETGRTFVVALLACGWPNNKNYKWSDTKKLVEYGLENYFYREFAKEEGACDESCLKPVPVTGGVPESLGTEALVPLELHRDTEGMEGLLLREDEQVLTEYRAESILEAPVKKGQQVGRIDYIVDGVSYRTDKIVTAESVEKIDFSWCVYQILERFLQRKDA